jgi:hypothetical protein
MKRDARKRDPALAQTIAKAMDDEVDERDRLPAHDPLTVNKYRS